MEFVTLTKDDPDFEPYLLGTFSKTHRALPVETFHPQTARERVTFRVLPVEKIARPAWWRVYLHSCRPELLGLTLGPAVAAWLSHHHQISEWTRWPSWFALLGVFFLHTAAFLFNDVQDHLRGADRLNRRRGSQVIQRGWVSAWAMRRWAWLNAALAVLFGVPAFLKAPLDLALVCLAALVCLIVIGRRFAIRWGVCDLALAALFGPLLTCGIAYASFGSAGVGDLAVGLVFGALAVWVIQVRQFEGGFRSAPESSHTFVGYCDFDRARVVLMSEGVALLLLQPLLAWQLGLSAYALLWMPLISAPLILLLARFSRAASPLSSSLVNVGRLALVAQLTWGFWWIGALGLAWLPRIA